MKTISTFDGEYAFLSNFYGCSIICRGLTFGSVEAAFQASKTLDSKEFEAFTQYPPNIAKRKGRKVNLRADWDDVKVTVMHELVLQKFTRHPDLAIALLRTGDAELIEGNYWHDTFWGVCNGVGENHLGKILMEVRDKISKTK